METDSIQYGGYSHRLWTQIFEFKSCPSLVSPNFSPFVCSGDNLLHKTVGKH